MRFEFKSSFDRSVKTFTGREKEEIKQVAIQAVDILSHDRLIHKGIGLKRLKNDFGSGDTILNSCLNSK